MPSHADFSETVPDIIGRFGFWPHSAPEPVAGGSLNWNFGVDAEGERLFVRRYRDGVTIERVRAEHALTGWVAERGIPAPVPFKTDAGESVLAMAGGLWAVHPWVDGVVRERGSLTAAQAELLGAAHGATQAVLAEHPDSSNAALAMSWDKGESLEWLGRIIEAAEARTAEPWMLSGLHRQLSMLRDWEVLPPGGFGSLPAQLLHGDFHDHQVLWDGDEIVAIVDWELCGPNPRSWELIRSLAFSQFLGAPGMEAYLAGYRRFIHLSEAECRLGLRLWWQSRVVGLWAWAKYFLEGDERVAKFLPQVVTELEHVADEGWRAGIEERFVRAACG